MPRGLRGGISINQYDLRNLNRKLKKMAEIDKTVLRKVVRQESNDTIHRMKNHAPVKTGRLKRNIGYTIRGDSDALFFSDAIDPDTGENYPPLQEFGTRFYPAQPYFYHNVRQFFSDVRARLGAELRKIINS